MKTSHALKPRYWHSATATCYGPELTEVLVIGGRQDWSSKHPISETTILRFGKGILESEVTVYGGDTHEYD